MEFIRRKKNIGWWKVIVQLEVQGQRVFISWVRPSENIMHIVRDINEAKVYSEAQARKLKKRYAHCNAKLIRRKKKIERETSI